MAQDGMVFLGLPPLLSSYPEWGYLGGKITLSSLAAQSSGHRHSTRLQSAAWKRAAPRHSACRQSTKEIIPDSARHLVTHRHTCVSSSPSVATFVSERYRPMKIGMVAREGRQPAGAQRSTVTHMQSTCTGTESQLRRFQCDIHPWTPLAEALLTHVRCRGQSAHSAAQWLLHVSLLFSQCCPAAGCSCCCRRAAPSLTCQGVHPSLLVQEVCLALDLGLVVSIARLHHFNAGLQGLHRQR